MDWRALLSNRWVVLGGAAAAGVGVVVFIARKRSSSAAANTSDGGETAGYGAGGVGYFDSVATDVATQLGQYQQGWQNAFNEFTAGVNDQLRQIPAGGESPASGNDAGVVPPGFPGDLGGGTRTRPGTTYAITTPTRTR